MRFLRKINKGLVLTNIVIIAVVIHLVNVETKRSAEKPQIEKTAKEYIELVDKYAILPEEYKKIYTKIKNEDEANEIDEKLDKAIEEQLSKFEEELKTKMVNNKTAIELQKNILEPIISQNNDFKQSVMTKYDREIKKIKKYEFDEDQVTITFDSTVEIETKYMENRNEKTKKNTQKVEDESITLKFEDGTWKVVYADLRTQPNAAAEMFGMF
mgnify:CR=1 FL=1